MLTLIVVVLVTILISSQCSLYEAVLYSTRMGTLEAEKNEPKRRSKALKMIKMKSRISMPLSAILVLNTVANTAGATVAGMYASKALGDQMIPLFSAFFTLAILIFAEIIPKTMGALYWRSLWPMIVWPLVIMKYSLYPFIILAQRLSDALGRQADPASTVTEEDILGTIRLGARGGEISQWESRMLHNIINLETMPVERIMTPRTVMFTLDERMTIQRAYELASERGFSRIPVYRGDRENIIGYVVIHDLSSAKALSQPDARLSTLVKPIQFVRESENCLVLMTHFLSKRRHIAMVGDEYGGVAGLVTLEDVLETVLGAEIVDENDSVVDLQKMARKRMQQRYYIETGEETTAMERETQPEFGDDDNHDFGGNYQDHDGDRHFDPAPSETMASEDLEDYIWDEVEYHPSAEEKRNSVVKFPKSRGNQDKPPSSAKEPG